MLLSQEYQEQWSGTSTMVFRFLFCYFTAYILLIFCGSLFESPVIWLGKNVLGIDYSFEANGYGSGDNTYAYVILFVNMGIAILATFIWSLANRNRKAYNQMLYWFLIIIRVSLICTMFLYGFVKVFQIQFPSPSLIRLLEPLGNFSPMGLAWTYMGYSKGFGMFAGCLEILGGLLLIPRRTQTLGALVIIGVMVHVAMMNFMFDIPVKLLSIHLIIMAGIIFITDSKRFLQVFVKNEPTTRYVYYAPVTDTSYPKTIFWVKTIGLVLLMGTGILLGSMTEIARSDVSDRSLLYGIWEAKRVIQNKDTIPPLITDSKRWRYLIIDQKNSAIVKYMDDSKAYFKFKTDTLSQTISMYGLKKDTVTNNLSYSYPSYSVLEIEGILENDSVAIFLQRKNLDNFLLKSRGFHWINERPLNK